VRLPRIWTFVALDLDPVTPDARSARRAKFASLASGAGGSVLATTDLVPSEGGAVVCARFPLAMDALRAVLEVRARAALHTVEPTDGDPDDDHRATADGLAVVHGLLAAARGPQVLVTATTAALVGPGLPAGLELVALAGDEVAAAAGADRVHELRTAGDGASDGDHPPIASNLGWAHRAATSPVVGREPVLAALGAAWEAAIRGERRVVLLVGEGGIGKTAVAAELALRAHADGALVLYGRWERESIAPYQAFREALGTYAAAAPADRLRTEVEDGLGALRRLLPDVAGRLGDRGPEPAGDPDGERAALYAAVAAWHDRMAADRPVLLVLDDLHWADRSSQRLLDHLCRHPGRAPWTIVVTARPGTEPQDPDRAWPGPGPAIEAVDVVGLGGIEAPAIGRLIQRELGTRLAPEHEAVAWLARATAGNPFLVRQVLDGVRGSTDVAAALLAARADLPEPLTDVIRWRLGHLPAPSRAVMADAAVLGMDVDVDLLGEALARPPVLLHAALEPAVAEHLLCPVPPTGAGALARTPAGTGAGPPERSTFVHEVVQRALHDELPADRAGTLHRRIAAALEARAATGRRVPAAEIAHHHLAGADGSTALAAVTWARRAAVDAREATAFDEAVDLLERAVAVHDRRLRAAAGADAAACELRLELAEAHDLAGRARPRDDRFVEAADLARSAGRSDLFARAALGYGGRLPAATMPDPVASGLLEEALDRLPAADGAARALVTGRLAQLGYFAVPLAERRRLADDAVGMARRVGDATTVARALMSHVLALDGPDAFDEAAATADEVVRIGEDAGEDDLVLQGLRVRITSLLADGRPHDACRVATAYRRRAERTRHQEHRRVALMWEIFWAGFECRFDDVELRSTEVAEQLDRAGHPHAALVPFAYSLVPRWLGGRIDIARPVVEFLHAADPDTPGWWAQSIWIDAASGHLDQAIARLDERDPHAVLPGIPRDIMYWATLMPWAIVASHGHRGWAGALHDLLQPDADRWFVSGFALFGGAAQHHLGTLALALDRPDEAVERLERALGRHRAIGAPAFVGLSGQWLAEALHRRAGPGDEDRATLLHDEVAGLIAQHGLHGLRSPLIPRISRTHEQDALTGRDDR
jgi:hypothetical protein